MTKTNKAAFNSPAGVKAIEWYVDLVNKDKVAVPGVLSATARRRSAPISLPATSP